MTNNLKEGILEFVPAVTQIVDANQIIENLTNQIENAKKSAEASLRNNWNTLNDKKDKFSTALLGTQPSDLGKVATHLLGLTSRIDELISSASNLSSSVINLVTSAANAGKNGFLTSINANKNNAHNAYSSITAKSKALIMAIAKEKAKNEAITRVRELLFNKNKVIALEVKPTRKLTPLKNAIQLKAIIIK